jgi:hypothetical protein
MGGAALAELVAAVTANRAPTKERTTLLISATFLLEDLPLWLARLLRVAVITAPARIWESRRRPAANTLHGGGRHSGVRGRRSFCDGLAGPPITTAGGLSGGWVSSTDLAERPLHQQPRPRDCEETAQVQQERFQVVAHSAPTLYRAKAVKDWAMMRTFTPPQHGSGSRRLLCGLAANARVRLAECPRWVRSPDLDLCS